MNRINPVMPESITIQECTVDTKNVSFAFSVLFFITFILGVLYVL
jgi:hypothetical protein